VGGGEQDRFFTCAENQPSNLNPLLNSMKDALESKVVEEIMNQEEGIDVEAEGHHDHHVDVEVHDTDHNASPLKQAVTGQLLSQVTEKIME
jgi:hypothetical protein